MGEADGIGMSVVSDSWAGLRESLHQLGIGHYFAGVVVSAELGCRKPDPRMYAAGSDLLGLPPGVCLFVDDDPATRRGVSRGTASGGRRSCSPAGSPVT